MFGRLLKRLFITIPLVLSGCSSHVKNENVEEKPLDFNAPNGVRSHLRAEDSSSLTLELISFKLGELGYSSEYGVVSNGEETFYGLIYSDFLTCVETDEGEYLAEAGFFQIVSDVEQTPSLFTPDKLDETKLFVGKGEDEELFVITLSLPSFESFAYVSDGWYNLCKRVSEYVLEVKTLEDVESNYDQDVSCYSFDDDRWVFKSDEDILNFNVNVIGYYSDYSKAYLAAIEMFKALIEIQDQYTSFTESYTYVILSGDIINSIEFSGQEAVINGRKLSELLETQSQLASDESLSITADGVSVIKNEEYYVNASKKRVQKGVISLVANLILLGFEVYAIVCSWGSGAPVLAAAVVKTVAAVGASIYAISNVVEAVQDVSLGAAGDIETKSINALKEGFIGMFGSEKAGTIAYNVFGIACSLVSALSAPVASLIQRSISAGMKTLQVVLHVAYYISVELIKIALTAVSSIAIGSLTGQIVQELTGDEIIAGYAQGVATIASALLIGYGLGKLDQKLDYSGYQLKSYYKSRAKTMADPEVRGQFEKDLNNAYKNANKAARKEIAEAIKNGRDLESLEEYGLHSDNPKHRALYEDIKTQLANNGGDVNNLNWHSSRGDPAHWEFAHGVDRSAIKEAVYKGYMTPEKAITAVSNPQNGSMVPYQTHIELHNYSFKNRTNLEMMKTIRPSVAEYLDKLNLMVNPAI